MTARLRAPSPESIVRFPATQRPILVVVVDTEEEFDWSADFDRRHTSVSAMRHLPRGQRIFDEFGIRPVYVVDFPVASQPAAAAPFRELHTSGRAEIGAHLHPWVCPPHLEAVNRRHSYPGNLPAELERAKLRALVSAIEEGIGVRPAVYKAGRYGLGPNSWAILQQEGFEVDLSVCPPFDFREDGGPDFSAFPPEPFWFGGERRLLAVPTTGAYVPAERSRTHRFCTLAARCGLGWTGLPGVLSRWRARQQLKLSPEGFGARDNRHLTRVLLERGVRSFTFMFHSPSLKPGCTPYVRTEAQLVRFVDTCRRYFEFFLSELGGVSMTATELKHYILRLPPAATP